MQPREKLDFVRAQIKKSAFLIKLRQYLRLAGLKITYAALLLYHAYHGPETPSWAKRIILGSLAYLVAPLDMVPDLTPFLGFTDDFGVLMFGLVSIAGHITDDTRVKARKQLGQWFGKIDRTALSDVDARF